MTELIPINIFNYACLDPIFTDIFDFILLAGHDQTSWTKDLAEAQIFLGLAAGVLLVAYGLLGIAKMFSEMDDEERAERERQRQEEEEERRQREEEIRNRLDNQPQEPPA